MQGKLGQDVLSYLSKQKERADVFKYYVNSAFLLAEKGFLSLLKLTVDISYSHVNYSVGKNFLIKENIFILNHLSIKENLG